MSKKVITIKSSIRIMGKTYKAEGRTVEDAITKLEPLITKGTAILSLEKGKLRREKILSTRTVEGIFGKRSPIMRNRAVKNIINLFNDFDK